MQETPKSCGSARMPDHQLTDHSGILRIEKDASGKGLHIDFDPKLLSEGEFRQIVDEHRDQLASAIRKSTFRIESDASEAVAQKLEKRVTHIPGVRRATATFIGKVLSVTFDTQIKSEEAIIGDLKQAGANIQPLRVSLMRAGERAPLGDRKSVV